MADITFTGNLGGEPSLDFKPSGNACLAFRVADTKGKKDAQGNWDKDKEQTQWFRCTLWGPDAEYYVERLRKGARVTVFGELMSREYVDNQGVNRTSLDVTVRGISIVNKRNAEQQPSQATYSQGAGNVTPDHGSWGGAPIQDPPF